MRRVSLPIALLMAGVGLVLGAIAVAAWRSPTSAGANLGLHPVRSAELGSRIMARVGKDFVAYRRSAGSGITFYDRPKPFDSWLCRVNAFYVPEKVLTGAIKRTQDRWEDNLSVETLYGVWKKPSLGRAGPDSERHQACARFNDFDHLISERGELSIDRGVYLFDRILSDAKSGGFPPNLSCNRAVVTSSGISEQACDATAFLRSLTLSDLARVERVSNEVKAKRLVDQLWLRARGTDLRAIVITSDEKPYDPRNIDDRDIRSVEITIEDDRVHGH